MKTELKPCPFCGDKVTLEDNSNLTNHRTVYWVACHNCSDLDTPCYFTASEVIEDWNTRPLEDALQSRITELEGKLESACHSDAHFRNETKLLQARITELENDIEMKSEAIKATIGIKNKHIARLKSLLKAKESSHDES